MNEWYAKDTSNKIKSIFLSRMNAGKRCSGSIPYGYNRLPEDKQTLVVDPIASQVVKHIFELAADGLTPPAIARQLTEEKVLIPSAYTQAFQELYYCADHEHKGALPVPVRVIQDEWANVAQPDSHPKILATCRSRQIFLNIIVQNIASIKALYKDEWEGIIGNCDELLYLGGNEQGTHEYISKMLGKETIDTRTHGKTKGRSGSYSTNYQNSGRELLTGDEVRLLDNDYALLFVRGERAVIDRKYDIRPLFLKGMEAVN